MDNISLEECIQIKSQQNILNAVLENADHIIYITDNDGIIQYVNPAFEKNTQFSKEEAIGKNSNILKSGLMDNSYYKELWETITAGKSWSEEIINKRKDGSIYYAYQVISPVKDEDGNITNYTAIQNDITAKKLAETRINSLSEDYESIFNNVQDSIFLVKVNEGNFSFQRLNAQHEKLTGLKTRQVRGKSPVDLLGPELGNKIENNYRKCLETKATVEYEELLNLPGGLKRWKTHLTPVFRDNKITQIIGVSRDITSEYEATHQKDILFNISTDLICIINKDGQFQQFNPAWDSITGYTDNYKIEENFFDFIHPEDRENANMIFEMLYKGETLKSLDLRLLKKDGSSEWFSWNAIYDIDTELTYAVGRNISNRKNMERNLIRLSTTDNLTGTYNRNKMSDVLEQEVSRSARYGHPLSLIMIDIDHFKNVNDSFGHDIGDKTLKSLVHIAEGVKRETDIFSRWGGEEFLMLCPETDLEGGLLMAERLRDSVEKYHFEKVENITISLGVAEFSPDKHNVDLFVKQADDALYKSKSAGRNKVST